MRQGVIPENPSLQAPPVSRRAEALLTAALLLWCAAASPAAHGQELGAFPRESLEIASSGTLHRFQVEIAVTPAQREQGLMFRKEIPEGTGMLFVNGEERPVAMWMKNTLVPLDMLFLAADGTIVKIHPEAEPLSTRLIASNAPVKGILELRGGAARKLGIVPGDRILHPAFIAPTLRSLPAH